MSMPSSSELVATTAGRRPALSSDSVRVRSARLIEPWCARARIVAASRVSTPTAVPDCAGTAAARSVAGSGTSSPERSAQTSFIRAVSRSAPRRELVNTRVDRCSATRSTTRSSTCGQIDGRGSGPAAAPDRSRSSGVDPVPRRSDRSGTGTTTSTSIFLVDGGCTTTTGRPPSAVERAPPRNSATASTGRTVADSPMRCAGPGPPGWSSSASSRSSESGEVRAALGAGDRVDLVDDHRPHPGEPRPGARREHEVERLGRGDEDVRRLRREGAALVRRGVAGADADGDVRQLEAQPGRRLPDADQRGAQVALDVRGERLERGDVQHAAPLDGIVGPLARSGARPAPTGTRRASCRTRSGRRPARGRRRRPRSTPRAARSWARRTHP